MGCLKIDYSFYSEPKLFIEKNDLTSEKSENKIRRGQLFGFNGKEKDNEINVDGGSYDFGARIYDGRLGRWLSLDPLQKKYPALSPYNFCSNNPIAFIDRDGKVIVDANGNPVTVTIVKNDKGKVLSITYEFVKGTDQAVIDNFNANAGVLFTELTKTKRGTKQIEKARDDIFKHRFEVNEGQSKDDTRIKDEDLRVRA